MLSAGVSASDCALSGLTPSVIVPRMNAPDVDTISTPRPTTNGASAEYSTPLMRTSA